MTTVKLNCTNGNTISVDVNNITAIYITGTTADILLNIAPYKVTVLIDDAFSTTPKQIQKSLPKAIIDVKKNFWPRLTLAHVTLEIF